RDSLQVAGMFILKQSYMCYIDTPATEIYTLSLHDALPISFRKRILPTVLYLKDGAVFWILDLLLQKDGRSFQTGRPKRWNFLLVFYQKMVCYFLGILCCIFFNWSLGLGNVCRYTLVLHAVRMVFICFLVCGWSIRHDFGDHPVERQWLPSHGQCQPHP